MISFATSEDQELVQATVRKFAADELRPRLRELEQAGGVPDGLARIYHGLGVALVDVPEELGGTGLGAATAALVHEELAFGDAGAAVALPGPGFAAPALVELAEVEQARRLLAPFAEAPLRRGAVAWSDGAKRTTARRDGTDWIIDGEKAFVIDAGAADLVIVFAETEAGRAAFAVDGKNPGMVAGPRAAWLGLETVRAAGLTFKDCRVADADRLAFAGDAARVRRFFARAALTTAARQVGLARASYEAALAYTQDREAFGKPVAHFQAISFTLADMHMDVESARWMVWRAAAELDQGLPSALVSVAKAAVHANDAAWRVADNGVQLLGGAGFIQDFPLEKWMRDTKTLALVGGTDQLAQLTIAAHAVGRPDEHGDGLPDSILQPVVT